MAQFTPVPEAMGAFVAGAAVRNALLDQPVGAPQWLTENIQWLTGNIEERLRGADFTVNALALTAAGDIIDPHGGLDDLKNKRLRLQSQTTLRADPLSPLRAVYLAANLGLELETETRAFLKDTVSAQTRGELAKGTPAQLGESLNDILLLARAGQAFLLLEDLGLLALYLPELAAARTCAQGGYHHLDVLGHSLEALNQLVQGFPDADLTLRWATLLHDVGKPPTKTFDDTGKHYHFYGHDKVGAAITRDILQRLKQSDERAERSSKLVRYHMLPLPKTEKTARRFAGRRRDLLPDLLQLMLADREAARGRMSSEASRTAYRLAVGRVLAVLAEPQTPAPLLSGQEIMALLGLTEGPAVGKAVRFLAESEAAGDATTREEAEDLLRHYLKKQLENARNE